MRVCIDMVAADVWDGLHMMGRPVERVVTRPAIPASDLDIDRQLLVEHSAGR